MVFSALRSSLLSLLTGQRPQPGTALEPVGALLQTRSAPRRVASRKWSRAWPWLVLLAVLSLGNSTAFAAREPTTPEEMYERAGKLMQRGYYDRAVELYERVKTRYPFSQYAVLAELRIGDSFFKRGEYPSAVDAYQTFLKLHPRHPEIDYVIYQIALCEFKQAPKIPQRDQAPTRRMLTIITGFEERFPKSTYAEKVASMRLEGRLRMGKGVLSIGQFYFRRARFQLDPKARALACQAAGRRFEQVLDEFPELSELGAKALYYKGLCEVSLYRKAEVSATIQRMQERFPQASQRQRLQAKAKRIGSKKPIPTPSFEEQGPPMPRAQDDPSQRPSQPDISPFHEPLEGELSRPPEPGK